MLATRSSFILLHIICASVANSFTVPNNDNHLPLWTTKRCTIHSTTRVNAVSEEESGTVQEYKNAATSILSNFMGKKEEESSVDDNPISGIDFDAAKFSKSVDIGVMARILDAELYEKAWFVTGNVNPIYFSENFEFQDPDVKVSGIEDYAKGVYKLFNQKTSRAEIISTEATAYDTITCTWRLSGDVDIGPGLSIKPYICYTDFKIDVDGGSGLILSQEDRFDIPGWDILLSALFPFLIGTVTSEPAPPVVRDPPVMPKL